MKLMFTLFRISYSYLSHSTARQ